MINLNIITTALTNQINNDPDVRAILNARQVIQGEFINVDPNLTPWIGVYRGNVRYEPRTLGNINNWEAFPSVRVIVQAADIYSAENCEADLEEYVKAVMTAISNDTTIGGTVDMITGYTIEPGYIETERTTVHFQAATITIDFEVMTQ